MPQTISKRAGTLSSTLYRPHATTTNTLFSIFSASWYHQKYKRNVLLIIFLSASLSVLSWVCLWPSPETSILGVQGAVPPSECRWHPSNILRDWRIAVPSYIMLILYVRLVRGMDTVFWEISWIWWPGWISSQQTIGNALWYSPFMVIIVFIFNFILRFLKYFTLTYQYFFCQCGWCKLTAYQFTPSCFPCAEWWN